MANGYRAVLSRTNRHTTGGLNLGLGHYEVFRKCILMESCHLAVGIKGYNFVIHYVKAASLLLNDILSSDGMYHQGIIMAIFLS